MGKKIEIDIASLKNMGLSQKQISEIIKNAEPDHWTNKLPQQNSCYELLPFMITPESRLKERVTIYCAGHNDPALSFFTEDNAQFIQNKCRLLIEMSNFSFAVNENWLPDWNDKEIKKYGIVLQNGQAVVKENEFFNVFVFGIVTNSLSLAREMLEEFKERIEEHFNTSFVDLNPRFERPDESHSSNESLSNESITDVETMLAKAPEDLFHRQKSDETEDNISKRKKVKFLDEEDVPKIQQMLFNKVKQKKIAEYFGYSEGTISVLKKRLGFKMKKMPPRTPNHNA